MTHTANIVHLPTRQIFRGEVVTAKGYILSIKKLGPEKTGEPYLMPGFVDAHVHVESSMLVPSEFARLAVRHGTVATVSDPHEIGNVLGIEGVKFMIENGKEVPFKFYFGAPSCVPATTFETAGATIDADGVRELLNMPEVKYLSEMMNYPGVLMADPVVMEKIAIAKELNKPVDGHAPGLRGEEARKYMEAGISTDHECFTYEEGLDKLKLGMKVLIREGSAAKNFEALIGLLPEFQKQLMFCSDDKHPDDLLLGHINQLAARALKKGCALFDVLEVACMNPVRHYGLEVGLLEPGDPADFILVEDLQDFRVIQTWIKGQLVAEKGESHIDSVPVAIRNQFNCSPKTAADFQIKAGGDQVRVIEALDGELVTRELHLDTARENGWATTDTDRDLLKIAVVNRYKDAPPAVAFIHGFHLREGAIASCVGHDSHNIIAVGVTDEAIARAVNRVIENQGGISAVGAGREKSLALPIAGIMSNGEATEVAQAYSAVDRFAKEALGTTQHAPFMTLSFMALLVIPQLKLSDKGLFDGGDFKFVELFI